MRNAWWMIVLAGCGGKAAAPAKPAPSPEARVALAEVDASALGDVHAASYLIVGADGKLGLGLLDGTNRDVDVSSLTPTSTETLDGWYTVDDPPIPRPPDEDAGVFGVLSGVGGGAFGSVFGEGDASLGGDYPTTTTPCGTAFHLDGAEGASVALLIADSAADLTVVLGALDQMPQPVALLARGDDARGRALRLIVDGQANITGDAVQAVITPRVGETAGAFLAELGGLAARGTHEVVIDRGMICTIVDMTGGYSWGDPYGSDIGGEPPPDEGGWGTVGTGSGGGGVGYGYGHSDYKPPRIQIGEVKLAGDGETESPIQEYVELASTELEACVADDVAAEGTVTVKVKFTAKGAITKVTAKGVSDAIDDCIESVLMAISFPEGDADASASFAIKVEQEQE